MSCSSWAKKSSCMVPQGRGRDRRTGSSGMRRDPRLSAGWSSEVTGEKPGSRLEDRSADAPLRQQTSGSSPLRFAKFTQNRVQRVTFTDPFGRFVAKHPANKRFIVTNSEQRELGWVAAHQDFGLFQTTWISSKMVLLRVTCSVLYMP